MDLDFLKSCDVSWFEGRTGFAVHLKEKKFFAFSNPDQGLARRHNWTHETFELSDLREVASKVGQSTEYLGSVADMGGILR